MLLFQRATELPDQLAGIRRLYASHDLCRKMLPLYTAHGQRLAQALLQAPDALLDDALDPSRKGCPIESRPLHPTALVVADQVAPLLHGAQQLDGKERVPAGVMVEGLAKSLIQSVGLGVENGVQSGGLLPPGPDPARRRCRQSSV